MHECVDHTLPLCHCDRLNIQLYFQYLTSYLAKNLSLMKHHVCLRILHDWLQVRWAMSASAPATLQCLCVFSKVIVTGWMQYMHTCVLIVNQ